MNNKPYMESSIYKLLFECCIQENILEQESILEQAQELDSINTLE